MSDYPPLSCSTVVYRVARNRSMMDEETGNLSAMAFIRYRERDEDGLSVFLGAVDTPLKAAQMLNRPHGVGSLHTGRVRDTTHATLDVRQDAGDHGCVVGLPFYDDAPELSERLATRLMAISRTCWRR